MQVAYNVGVEAVPWHPQYNDDLLYHIIRGLTEL
jgi:hypothetical protein